MLRKVFLKVRGVHSLADDIGRAQDVQQIGALADGTRRTAMIGIAVVFASERNEVQALPEIVSCVALVCASQGARYVCRSPEVVEKVLLHRCSVVPCPAWPGSAQDFSSSIEPVGVVAH